MLKVSLHCPYCHLPLALDTTSGEEFSCAPCGALVDLLDEDLAMVSRAPHHQEVAIIPTCELRLTPHRPRSLAS